MLHYLWSYVLENTFGPKKWLNLAGNILFRKSLDCITAAMTLHICQFGPESETIVDHSKPGHQAPKAELKMFLIYINLRHFKGK